MKNRSAIIILSNSTIAEKLKIDLMTFGFSDIINIQSLESIISVKSHPSTDLVILELKEEDENWWLSAKAKIQELVSSTIPILIYTDDGTARRLVKKDLLNSFGYLSHSFTLRELELCIDASFAKDIPNTNSSWLDEAGIHTLFNFIPNGIIICDEFGRILDVNNTLFEILGYTKEELCGRQIVDIVPKYNQDKIDKNIERIISGEIIRSETINICKDGAKKYLSLIEKRITLPNGKYGFIVVSNDITRGKEIDKALLESEDKYRTLAEQIPVGIYRTSENGEFYYANPALANILGFDSVDDLIKHNVNEFYYNVEERHNVLKSIRSSEGYVQKELMLTKKDGKKIWIRDNGRATFDSYGTLLFFDGVIENITEQKETNEALRESESNLRAMLKAIPDLLFRLNREGIYLDFFASSIEEVLITKDKIVGHSISDFFSPDTCKQIFLALETCLATGKLQTIEYTTLFDGRLNFYEARIVPAGDNEVLSLARNISNKKKAEEKITMLAQTIMNVVEFISISDLEDRFIYVNPAFLKNYGYTEEEIIGKHISIIRPTSVNELLSNEILNKTQSGGWQGELRNIRKDGSELIISLSTSVIRNENEEPIAFVGVATDITDRKLAEMELISAKDKAEESDRLKTSFLANMSHEIRSPMNAILGFIRILKEEEKLSEDGKQYIDLISTSGMQLLSVIEDIIDTSKIQANQLRLSIHEFDLNALLTDTFTIFSTQVRERVPMNTILLPPLLANPSPFLFTSDDLRIRQILTNLLSNALKFTPKGVIEFGYSVILDNENPLIQFFVRDTGIGLAPDKQNLIFERFRQADDSYTRMYGGSGLGLAISKGLVMLLGGKIWVESEVGKGSIFYFTLPIRSTIDEKKEKFSEEGKVSNKNISRIEGLNWSNKTILIVEDMEDIQFYLKKVLKKTSANLIFASSLSEAREMFSSYNKIDLVLLDVRLPDGDGYELSREFKNKKPEIPIIAQTAYAMQGEKEKSASFGCDDFISKPINPDLLYFIIQNIFQKGE